MPANRSLPASSVVPVLAYPDVSAANDWLCNVFGFREASHGELVYGNGAVILVEGDVQPATVLVRVDDASTHHDRARAHGAQIASEPADDPTGGRRYTALDPAGHTWIFCEPLVVVDAEIDDAAADDTDWVRVFSAPDDPGVMPDR